MDAARSRTCVCGHAPDAHEHYRRGTDCARCEAGACVRFRSASGLAALLRRLLGTGPAAPARPPAAPRVPSGRPRLHVADSHDSAA